MIFFPTFAEVGAGSAGQQQLNQLAVTNMDGTHERSPLKAQTCIHVHTWTQKHNWLLGKKTNMQFILFKKSFIYEAKQASKKLHTAVQ